MNKIFLLAALLFASVMGAPRTGYSGPVWPRMPLGVLLNGQRPEYDHDNKIVGGNVVVPNSLPFQVSMQRGTSHYCGGSIYNSNVIICAAHCVEGNDPRSFRIVAGEHDLTVSTGLEQVRSISKFVAHENYGTILNRNDISLIILSNPLDLSVPSAGPVTLPAVNQTTPAGTRLFVSGWGRTSSGGPPSDQLRSVMVPAVSDADCRASYGNINIADSMICAGVSQGGVDSCQGDSGGPLFSVNADDTPKELIGIVSWGQGCALPGYPGVYTEVSYFVDWIKTNAKLTM